MDTQERNAEDIRSLTAALTSLTREMGVNNEKTGQAIKEAEKARDELAVHVVECNDTNRRLERTLWGVGGLLVGLGLIDKWGFISAALGL